MKNKLKINDIMKISDFSCIACGSKIIINKQAHCMNCQKQYAIIEEIPILVSNVSKYAAAIYKLYHKFILDKQDEIADLQLSRNSRRDRSEALNLLIKAIEHNNTKIKELIEPVSNWVEKEDLIRGEKTSYKNIVLKDFAYLKRDWTWLEEDESQLSIIMIALKEALKSCTLPFDKALVVGSGLGRIAFELSDLFNNVYATDLSFSMIHCFHQILRGATIDFYEINYGNIRHTEGVAQKLTAQLTASYKEDNSLSQKKDRLHYFVSDVLKSPFADRSLPYILSIYFTDVLPIRLFLPEIARILQIGGYFVHLGPLGYGNTDMPDRLSCEETKQYFEENGFKIVYENFIGANHLDSKAVLTRTYFHNWVFVAQKQDDIFKNKPLIQATKLSVTKNLHYTISGDFGNEQEKQIKVYKADGSSFDMTAISLEMIQYIAGDTITLKQLINYLEEKYDIDTLDAVTDLIENLINLRIVEATTQ